MRKDFNKVLTERPRVGHANKHKSVRRQYNDFDYDDDDAPIGGIEGMKKPYNDRKNNSDLWNAIKRFMAKQVGRPWNDVFSEINRDLHESDDMRAHFLAHVRIEVDEKLDIAANGRLYRPRSEWKEFDWAETYPGEIPGLFKRYYIDPRNGVLCKAPKIPKDWVNPRWEKGEKEQPENGYEMDDGVHIKKIEGIWYAISITYRRESYISYMHDPMYRQIDDRAAKPVTAFRNVAVHTKRQLNTKELRTYNVENDV